VSLFALHGAFFLSLRLEGPLHDAAVRLGWRIWGPTVPLILLFVGAGYWTTDIFSRLGVNPGVAPVGAAGALLAAGWCIRNRHEGWAFGLTGLTIALSTLAVFQGLFPRVMISSLNPDWSLTIYNASSSPYTLGVMSWVALTFVPIVVGYQIWNYWIFRRRIGAQALGHL
jgi:cytochrome d ubiquinol oxidase subunit II